MKRIVLGLSLLLMLAQNGFAISDEELDQMIANSTGYMQQNIRCEKMAGNHLKTGNINECIKATEMLQKLPNSNPDKALYSGSIAFNTGLMAYFQGDKLKAYKYWMLAAKYGHKKAQKNLDILCRKSSWVCK